MVAAAYCTTLAGASEIRIGETADSIQVNVYTGSSPVAGADEGTFLANISTFNCVGAVNCEADGIILNVKISTFEVQLPTTSAQIYDLGIATDNIQGYVSAALSTTSKRIDDAHSFAASSATTLSASTSTLLDLLKSTASNLSAIGTINMADNPVDWTKFKNVPAGFADGSDDGGGGGSGFLSVGTGSVQAMLPVSSQTTAISLSSGVFKVIPIGSTAYIDVDYSSITAQGLITDHPITASDWNVRGSTLISQSDFNTQNTTATQRVDQLQVFASTGQTQIQTTLNYFSTHSAVNDNQNSTMTALSVSTAAIQSYAATAFSTHSTRIDEIQADLSTHSVRVDQLQVHVTGQP